MKKISKKKALMLFSIVKLPFTIYLIASLLMVPSIDTIQAKFIQGAHRGASMDFEENTLEAFDKAVEESKYQFIEFDIQYTKDKKIVVFHQNTMYRIPKNFVETSEMEYSELLEEFDFKIPQYQEVMDCIKQSKPINVEIKSHGNPEEDIKLAEFVIADFKERGMINQLLLSSPEEPIIEYVELNHPEINTSKICWVTLYSVLPFEFAAKSFYEGTKADYISMHGYNLQNYEMLRECQPEDKGIMFWYFTDEMYIPQDQGKFNQFWEDIDKCIEELK
jgi:glycerophosphoryl diester phosphodiesterase